ncbi:MAG: UvrD-helicase domain-containing protein [Planctomycetota bacterium]
MGSSEAILRDVNAAQREAITHGEGPLLVVAGAGSGKTRVITRRIAYLVSQGVPPWRILAITFTNKAAGEMRDRLQGLLGTGGAWISTFHALGARVLRRDGLSVGIESNFTIYDADDSRGLVKDCVSRLGLDAERFTAASVLHQISVWKQRRIGVPEAPAQAEGFFEQQAARVYALYVEGLREAGALDFDDLLTECLRLLESETEASAYWRQRFSHVLIDEYQDTNRVQYLIARALALSGNLVATGDPDQAIYSWRGADLRNILDFERDFPGTRLVKLEQNYRSTGNILAAASALIRNNKKRKERGLFTEGEAGERITLLACWDSEREADEVARLMLERRAQGFAWGDMAVFYRINALSRSFERALSNHNIPYVLVGGVEFYQRKEVRDLLAYLRVILNPRDTLSFLRIVNVPPRGIGKTTLEGLRARAAEAGMAPGALLLSGDLGEFSARARSALESLRDLLRGLAERAGQSLSGLLETVIERVGYRRYLEGFGGSEAIERVENVNELGAAVREFERRNPDADLQRFLEETALVQDVDQLHEDASHVTLMTLHAAKGLEFPVVFLVGLEEGLLPHARSAGDPDQLEEERRLCYVGMTRAQRHLTLSFAGLRFRFGELAPSAASRFLSEVPPDLLELVDCNFRGVEVGGLQVGRSSLLPDAETVFDLPDFEPDEPFGEGEQVYHRQFGVGTVLSVSGWGHSLRVTVEFPSAGRKTLLQEYARLRRVSS